MYKVWYNISMGRLLLVMTLVKIGLIGANPPFHPPGFYLKERDCLRDFAAVFNSEHPSRVLGSGFDGKVFKMDTPSGPVSMKKFVSTQLATANYELYELLKPLAGNSKKNGMDIVNATRTSDPTVLKLTYVNAAEWTPELKKKYWVSVKKFEKALREHYEIDVIESNDPDWGCVLMEKNTTNVLGELALHHGNVLFDKDHQEFVLIDPM